MAVGSRSPAEGKAPLMANDLTIANFFSRELAKATAPRVVQNLAATAATMVLAQAAAQSLRALGRTHPPVVIVDGRRGMALNTVKPDGGLIEAEYDIANEMLRAAIEAGLEWLRAGSPVVSGEYRDGHTLYVNGSPASEIPANIKPTDQIMIANPVPYARRIEVGVTKSGRAFVIQTPPRIYQRVAAKLSDRFGNAVVIKLADDPGVVLPNAGAIRGTVGRSGISTHHQTLRRRQAHLALESVRVRRRTHGGEQIMSPAIFFEAR